MSFWTYRAFPTEVIDGDTIEVCIDHGMSIRSLQRIRLLGVDAPELRSGDRRLEGASARDAVIEWLAEADDDGPEWSLQVTTKKDSRSFNRYVADVVRRSDGVNLGDWLVAEGFAVRTLAGKRLPSEMPVNLSTKASER